MKRALLRYCKHKRVQRAHLHCRTTKGITAISWPRLARLCIYPLAETRLVAEVVV